MVLPFRSSMVIKKSSSGLLLRLLGTRNDTMARCLPVLASQPCKKHMELLLTVLFLPNILQVFLQSKSPNLHTFCTKYLTCRSNLFQIPKLKSCVLRTYVTCVKRFHFTPVQKIYGLWQGKISPVIARYFVISPICGFRFHLGVFHRMRHFSTILGKTHPF